MKEVDIGAAVVALFRGRGFEVYQEVLCRTGDCVDIAATRGRLLVAVECKLAPTFEVMQQGLRWIPHAHHVYVAAALPRTGLHPLARRLMEDLGLGFIGVRTPRYGNTPIDVDVMLDPRLNRRAGDGLRRCLREEQKTFAPAGSSGAARWSPFKATVLSLQRYVIAHPGCTMKEAVENVDHHYGFAFFQPGRGPLKVRALLLWSTGVGRSAPARCRSPRLAGRRETPGEATRRAPPATTAETDGASLSGPVDATATTLTAVGADVRGRVLAGQDVVDANGGQPRDAEGQRGARRTSERLPGEPERLGERPESAAAGTEERQRRAHVRLLDLGQVRMGRRHGATVSVRRPGNSGSTPSWCIA
jgi:hypothetical protein